MAYFQKRSGAWRAIIKKKGHDRQTRTFDTKAEAEAWARAVEAEMDRGHFVSRKEAENTTLDEALDRYEREHNKKRVRQYTSLVNHWKRSSLAKRSLASIQGKDIAEYRDKRLQGNNEKGVKPVGPQTVLHEIGLLSRLYTTAIKEWGMGGLLNPVAQIRKPKMPRSRERRLLPGELEKIASASESPLLADIVRFAVETAMRREEISRIKWDHVDLKKKVLLIPQTKNEEPRRIPLSPEAVRILERIPRRIDGKIWGMRPDSITQAFIRAVNRAKTAYEKEFEEEHKGDKNAKPDPTFLVDLTFHDLRHEATSRFFEKGLNPMQVAAITGHKTLQMLKRYTHLKAEDLAELLK